jgi:hypothetical protein
MKKLLLTILLVTFASLSLFAQDKKSDKKGEMKHDHAAMDNKGGAPPMAKASPEIAKLIKMFSGTWTANEKLEPGPMAPNGGSGTGTAVFKAGPGGMSLIEDYNSPKGAMGPFKGHGVTWWDAKANSYKGTWCDSMAAECMTSTMKWEGDKLVAAPVEMDMGNGQKMTTTMQYTDFKPDSITFVMGMGPSADQAKTGMTIVYKKGAGAAMPAAKKEETKK